MFDTIVRTAEPSEQDLVTIDKINTMMVMYGVTGFCAKFVSVSKGSERPYKLICNGRNYGKNYTEIDRILHKGEPPIRHFESVDRLDEFVNKRIFEKAQELRRTMNVK